MDFLNEAKRVNMAANNEVKTPDNAPPDNILAELKDILADVQVDLIFSRNNWNTSKEPKPQGRNRPT